MSMSRVRGPNCSPGPGRSGLRCHRSRRAGRAAAGRSGSGAPRSGSRPAARPPGSSRRPGRWPARQCPGARRWLAHIPEGYPAGHPGWRLPTAPRAPAWSGRAGRSVAPGGREFAPRRRWLKTRCTRTHHAPAVAARAEMATVAASLPSKGRGAVRASKQQAQEAFAGRADQDRGTCARRATEVGQVGQQRPVVIRPFPRIRAPGRRRCGLAPGRHHRVDAGAELVADLGHHVGDGAEYMSRLCPRQCTTTYDTLAPAAATRRGICGSARSPLTSLTMRAPADSANSATAGRIVSMETGTPAFMSSVTTADPAQFLFLRYALGAGPGRLTAHVHEVGALCDQVQPVLDGRVRPEPPAAVGERVGRHVHHAHDQCLARARQASKPGQRCTGAGAAAAGAGQAELARYVRRKP